MEQQLLLEILHKVEANSEDLKDIKKTVNEHTRILNEHTRILDEHTRILDEHTRILDEHSKKLDEHTRILNEHSERLGKHDKTLSEHSSTLDDYREEFKSIKRTLFIIEDAVTNKIPALFDAHMANQEKHEEFDNRIGHVENVSSTNSLKISILEDTTKRHSKHLSELLS